ncbi:MAG: hypothetical protein MJY71_00470 [Bacteroidaceae bacterium]|nr:hypothetical protein [Bacteroidaceae bacterium]
MRTLRVILFSVVFLNIMNLISAQESPVTLVDVLEDKKEGQGTILVKRDLRLDSLIGTYFNPELSSQIKVAGYRIMVYRGKGSKLSQQTAMDYKAQIEEKYGNSLPVYCYFSSPRWWCTAGDFLYYEEAYSVMRKLKRDLGIDDMYIMTNQVIKVDLR